VNVAANAAQSGRSYAALTLISQGLSWAFTFFVIRLLQPRDYGLMTMAAFLTAYLQMFSGLGLGSAIVQRESINDDELQSVFWFSLAVGVAMALLAFGLAQPTAWLFDEPRVVPVTQLIGALFVISAVATVPTNLLTRQFELRKVALINVVAVVVSSSVSVVMALRGYGVFTLIWANIILNAVKAVLLFAVCDWRPRLHYSHRDLRPYLRYGIYVALSSAASRLFQSLDKFVIGKLFGAQQLGLYGNAMTIAAMPIDKISPLFQQVSFPLFARLQTDAAATYRSYLDIGRHYLLTVSPIYLGALAIAPDLIEVVFGARWVPMTTLFQVFCVAKLFEVLTSYQSVLLNAVGKHRSVFWFSTVLLVVIPLALLFAALHSFEAVAIPWLALYPLICIAWLWISLRDAQLARGPYLAALFDGTKGAFAMFVVAFGTRAALLEIPQVSPLARLLLVVAVGGVAFSAFLLVFQRDLVQQAIRTMFPRGETA
jgi:O-antigen/teichoic acid export membrane protein